MSNILTTLHSTLVEILDSKKAVMAIGGLVVILLQWHAGAITAPQAELGLAGLISMYLHTQGKVDQIKESTK